MVAFISKLVAGALPLFGGLPQRATNGNSNYGTPQADRLPKFLSDGSPANGSPWGNEKYEGLCHQALPDTGVTRYYKFDVGRAQLSPDGYQKDMIVVNGGFPGPLIEANWGDWIQVEVTNSIVGPEEGTTIHWHGFLQKETPWYDGVASVQQCPIATNASFTYTFRADHVGTSFYHSHYSAQTSAGVLGPIVIHGPNSQAYDIDIGPVLITDWFHRDYFSIIEDVMSADQSKQAPNSDNNLINGKMDFNCANSTTSAPCVSNAGLSKFVFEEGKTHLLRIINGGSAGLQYFSIDEHNLTVIANDFIPIEPYTTNVVTLGVGQRTDVLVHGKTGTDAHRAYFMRNNLSTVCALPSQPYGLAAIYYGEDAAKNGSRPNSQAQDFDAARFQCGNEPLTVTTPETPLAVAEPDTTIHIQVKWHINATGSLEWLQNGQTFRANYDYPILELANERNYSYPYDPEWSVYNTGTNKTVRIVWENDKNASVSFAHPMHLHGHDMQILSAGRGEWDGTVTNPENPLRRDTHILPPLGHLAVQYTADNPGIWPFHCHVLWHVSQGLYINMMERPEELTQMQIPSVVNETCAPWRDWQLTHVVDQIDSGLKMRE